MQFNQENEFYPVVPIALAMAFTEMSNWLSSLFFLLYY
jgi:hypothetical protein